MIKNTVEIEMKYQKDEQEIYQPEDLKRTKKKLQNPSEHFQDIDVRKINIIRLYFNYIKMTIVF